MKIHLFCFLFVTAIHAGPRTSSDYLIPAETTNAAGNRSTSAHYTHDGSAGGVSGISTATGESAKHGYIAQLYDPAALQLSASASTVPEGGLILLGAKLVMDDATLQPVDSTAVVWSVLSGPLSRIDAAGLTGADTVYQDTAATVQGAYSGLTGTLGLTVLDSIADNFGTYAADGLGDDWQVQYFGLDNPLAGPLLDPDGDSQDNRFEFIAGLVPTDPRSFFSLSIEPVSGESDHRRLVFGPCSGDRTYQILASTSLLPQSWSVLSGAVVSQDGGQRTVTDTHASEGRKFYRVEISNP